MFEVDVFEFLIQEIKLFKFSFQIQKLSIIEKLIFIKNYAPVFCRHINRPIHQLHSQMHKTWLEMIPYVQCR